MINIWLHVQKNHILFVLSLLIIKCSTNTSSAPVGVQLHIQDRHVVLDNGLVQVTLSSPEGIVIGVRYNNIENLLEVNNEEDNRGYWDIYWSDEGRRGMQDVIKGTEFRVIIQNEKQVEISFTRTWNPSLKGSLAPLNIDKRFIMLQGSRGFYSYSIFEHLKGWPDFTLNVTRLTFKLRKDIFRYMAMSEQRQRRMPLPDDRSTGQILAYPEAVLLVDPTEPQFRGEVDDKYQYSCNNEDNKVHGWVTSGQPVGFWHVTPSHEFRTGGPLKQELTSHVGPTTLTVFVSPHYMGQDAIPIIQNGEAWKKVFGPVFIYLNSGPAGTSERTLWSDANNQMQSEILSWPYNFPISVDFPKTEQRGSVHGRLFVRDRYINREDISASSAYVGLALPGDVGSWQREAKGYQFWTRAGSDGSFSINNVRAGIYNLYASVPGFIGDYKSNAIITITPGGKIELGNLVYEPPRDGPTLWEIGVPDRMAAEFFIPNPNPRHINPLYIKHDRFRQYGLWEQYNILYPNEDLVYMINASDYRKDWFFAHVPRKIEGNNYRATTWQIKFKLNNVGRSRIYKLRLALASASGAELQVRFNDVTVNPPPFTTGLIGKDNAIARHGIHGMYWLFNVDVKSDWLVEGDNVIFLTQARSSSPLGGVMYDYIRFEGLSTPNLN